MIGFDFSVWVFKELDAWEFGVKRNGYNEPLLAVGPFRFQFKLFGRKRMK